MISKQIQERAENLSKAQEKRSFEAYCRQCFALAEKELGEITNRAELTPAIRQAYEKWLPPARVAEHFITAYSM